ncbi:dUTP diphosphatase [Indiicoccus explosivorum]|uniref:dUTP diphosphatase n=1 Tax=Indiicoccus explosivorum TaxID=1917864 RepID=UPI000B4335F7|nr:dUTP diphosphatase [Indiicoccus explosivorum]
MNLKKLYEKQAELDAEIEKQHPNQNGEDRESMDFLALYAELGELLNEWRGFKYWSDDRGPRILKKTPDMKTFDETEGRVADWIVTNPLLEEYADCLHAILTLGNRFGVADFEVPELLAQEYDTASIVAKFLDLFYFVGEIEAHPFESERQKWYRELIVNFVELGKMLSFTWEEVEAAYLQKNKANHDRQANGY